MCACIFRWRYCLLSNWHKSSWSCGLGHDAVLLQPSFHACFGKTRKVWWTSAVLCHCTTYWITEASRMLCLQVCRDATIFTVGHKSDDPSILYGSSGHDFCGRLYFNWLAGLTIYINNWETVYGSFEVLKDAFLYQKIYNFFSNHLFCMRIFKVYLIIMYNNYSKIFWLINEEYSETSPWRSSLQQNQY